MLNWLRRTFRRPAPTCETCGFYSTEGICGHPKTAIQTNGRDFYAVPTLGQARTSGEICGPRGKLWTARP